MSTDYKLEYWLEALNSALDCEGYFEAIPDEAKIKIAKSLCISQEMQGMAFGYDAIPSRANSELDELKVKYEKQIKELEERELCYRKSVATRRRVELNRVYLHRDGSVMISPT